jgi:hypothetical protein
MVVANVASTKLIGVTNPISFATNGDLSQGLISIEQVGTVNGAAAWTQVANENVL